MNTALLALALTGGSPADDLARAETLHTQAVARRDQGRLEEAETLLKKSIELTRPGFQKFTGLT